MKDWRKEIASASGSEKSRLVGDFARHIRVNSLETIKAAGIGHVGGDFSATDILATIYGAVLNIDPKSPDLENRDRFIMSKGHAAASLYSAMALVGYFEISELKTFAGNNSRLGGHPNRSKLPGVETNTGPLGHGLPVAAGIATGLKLAKKDSKVFVLTGDGEMQEGSNWEAIMFAGHRKLNNLTLIVDKNDLQQGDFVSNTNSLDPLDKKLESFGWHVSVIDGHNHDGLLKALTSMHDKPHAIVAKTVKGKGVSFMENRQEWHHKVPSAEQFDQALKELSV